MLKDILQPRKPLSETHAVGVDFVHGNDMTLFEKRESKLTFMTPHYRPESMLAAEGMQVLEREPLRMSSQMVNVRSEEVSAFGKRKYKDARKLELEFSEKIKAMLERQRDEEESKRTFKKRRWWHRQADLAQRDPVKSLRFNNLKIIPEDLLSTKDIVTLHLTGCRLGDLCMDWVGAFLQQSYTIRRLNLQGNHITSEGCKQLFLGLRNCRTLTELDISLNPIGDDGIVPLCNALLEGSIRKQSNVYSINVSSCNLSSASGFHLARLVRENPILQSLCAWRNSLGVVEKGSRSGAMQILDELITTSHLRLLDLSCNNLTNQDLSSHCSALESNLRKTRLVDIEKRHRVINLQRLRQEISEKKPNAVWDDEKLEIARLEKELEVERARLGQYKKMDERSRTKEQKQDEEFGSDIRRHTDGLELVTFKKRLRLVINGNMSVQPTTIQRLREYYDVGAVQSIQTMVSLPRRHDNLINPRRQMGMEYQTRDHNTFDDHNIFAWDDGHNPADDFDRRSKIAAWREAEDLKKQKSKPVHFEKFKLNIHATAEEMKGKKLVSGVSVASGVNARVQTTTDAGAADGTGDFARRHQEKLQGDLKNDVSVKSQTFVVEGPTKTIIAPSADPIRVKKHTDESGKVVVTIVGGDHLSPEERGKIISEANKTEGPIAKISTKVVVEDDSVAKELEGLVAGADVNNVSEFVQRKLESRRREMRRHVAGHNDATDSPRYRPESADSRSPVDKSWLEADGKGYVPPSGPRSARQSICIDSPRGSQQQLIVDAISAVYGAWGELRRLSEIGSPTDEELANIERAAKSVDDKKFELLQILVPLGDGSFALDLEGPADIVVNFLEDILKETDSAAHNLNIFSTMVRVCASNDFFNLADCIDQRGWAAIAACDGSVSFLDFLLQHATQLDLLEVFCSCFYNSLCRISLARTALSQKTLNIASVKSDLQPITQEFFEDVASLKRALPREDRAGRLDLLRLLLHHPQITIDLEKESSSDGQTILSRALYEGDFAFLQLIFADSEVRGRIENPNMLKSDKMTPLMMAVLGNEPAVVSSFLKAFDQIDVNIVGGSGTAMDLAISLDRHAEIVAMLAEKGGNHAGSSNQETSSVDIRGGKMSIVVTSKK